ncbi:MAG: AMP-binding protein [Halieaceae bacterium]|nr:AMP-binding protein [Halieaceae bacterium]
MTDNLWTFGEAISHYAQRAPDEPVVIFLDEAGHTHKLSRQSLECRANQLAHALAERGVNRGDLVPIILPTSIEHIIAMTGVFKAGGTPMPVNHKLPALERDPLIELADPKCRIVEKPTQDHELAVTADQLAPYPTTPPERRISCPVKALSSGGSTGKPKLIISEGDMIFPAGQHPSAPLLRLSERDLKYSPGPLYHNGPFNFSLIQLAQGGRIMLNARFRADRALAFIAAEQPTVLNLVPTMMQRMLREPAWESMNLDFISHIWHLAAPCPEWAKLGFIEKLGGKKVLELWAATEATGLTIIDGDEWLEHRGSVGRGVATEFKILDEDRNELPPGEIGEIFTRFAGQRAAYRYLGADALEATEDGFESVGDLGWVDAEGYLYLADRRTDLIISGGANIFPAEVEAAISQHPDVRDVAVIGIKDDDLGRRVHAIIEPAESNSSADAQAMADWCSEHLARYKVPRTFEWVEALPRNEAGKIRRKALREERGG